MSTLDRFYDINPVGVIDQNKWTVQDPEVNLAFRRRSFYTPLIDWDASMQATGASEMIEHELIEGDVNFNEIPLTANYIDSMGVDSRYQKFSVARYGGKVQMHKSSNVFQQWKISGGRDWRPLLRGVLGDHVVRVNELLARNAWFKGPKTFWTYSDKGSGAAPTDWATIAADDKFDFNVINGWKFRLGNTGAPVVPGDPARAKVAYIPPGATYELMATLAAASANETALWRDAHVYGVQTPILTGEIGEHKGVRFVEVDSDKFGVNPNVLYNCGAVTKQFGVIEPIRMGDGAPDPGSVAVDSTWYVGQKSVTHYIKLEDWTVGDFSANDWVTIHVKQTAVYGVTKGVDPFDAMTIVRRVVAVDATANTISFDRPILMNYTAAFTGKSVTGNADGTFYAYVTRGRNIGFALVLGSRGGVKGKVMQPLAFYDPVSVDDFQSVWRFSYDQIVGLNIAEPHMFELYFFAVAIPKPGGVIG